MNYIKITSLNSICLFPYIYCMEKSNNNTNHIKSIKSKFILKKVFNNVFEGKMLGLIKYNKNTQQKLNIGLGRYINYSNLC